MKSGLSRKTEPRGTAFLSRYASGSLRDSGRFAARCRIGILSDDGLW